MSSFFSLNYHQQRIKYVLFYSTDRDTQEAGGNPKQPVRKSLCVGGMDFPPCPNKIIRNPPARQGTGSGKGFVCVSFPTSIHVLSSSSMMEGTNLGAAAGGVSQHVPGLGKVTLVGGIGRSWLPHTHTWMPQPRRDTGKHELRLHCPCPK